MLSGVEIGFLRWRKSSRSQTVNTCVEVADLPEGGRALRDSKDSNSAVLCFDAGEWAAFAEGVKRGEFD